MSDDTTPELPSYGWGQTPANFKTKKQLAEQRGSVALPVVLAYAGRLVLVHTEVIADILDHRTIDVREDVRAGVVQRVVEIEQPNQ